MGTQFHQGPNQPPLAVFGVVEIWYVVKIQQWTDFSSASLEILGVVNLAALSTPPTRLERISCPQCGNMSVQILHPYERAHRSEAEHCRVERGCGNILVINRRRAVSGRQIISAPTVPNIYEYFWKSKYLGNMCLKIDKFSNMVDSKLNLTQFPS